MSRENKKIRKSFMEEDIVEIFEARDRIRSLSLSVTLDLKCDSYSFYITYLYYIKICIINF